MRNCGVISRPLTTLLKKDQFQWGELADRAFNQLKQPMSTIHVLTIPNFKEPFVVKTDTSCYFPKTLRDLKGS